MLLVLLSLCCAATDPWDELARIESTIHAPVFPAAEFNILRYGAVAGNATKLNHEAINKAISDCSSSGGGRVVVPKGTFHTGPVVLKSNVNLHLQAGACLLFTTDVQYFYPAVLTRWEGNDCYNAAPLIYAYGCTNIAITGDGSIDGAGSNDTWWPMSGKANYAYQDGMISQKTGRPKLLAWEEANVPVEERVLTPADGMRPQLINLYRCSNIEISGVTLLRSPFWVIHPVFCKNMIVRNVNVTSHGPNNDGCDPESSSGVLIENCTFDTGDDCIAIKSGRNNDGRRWNIPSEDIIVRGSLMKDGHGGVTVGSEISGGYRNLFVEKCQMDSPNLERAIRIKTSTCRGGVIQNVNVRDIQVGQCKESILNINLQYEPDEACQRGFPPKVLRVRLERVTSKKSKYGVYILGLDEAPENVDEISLKDCVFTGVDKGNLITGAKPVEFTNSTVTK